MIETNAEISRAKCVRNGATQNAPLRIVPPDAPPAAAAAPAVPPLMLSRRDLARELRVSLATLDRLNAAGKLPAPIRLAGSLRWSRDSILEWIAAGCPARG